MSSAFNPIRAALLVMLHEARRFNAAAMQEAGIGPFDLVAVRQAEAALAAPPVDAVPGEPVAKLIVKHEFHDEGQGPRDTEGYILAIAVANSRAESLPIGDYPLYIAAPAASRAGDEPVKWGYAETVGNAIAQLKTMDASLPFYAALHLQDGRCIARGVTFSRERVVNERWIDNRNKDVPYSIVVWSQPVESLHVTASIAPAAAAEPMTDERIREAFMQTNTRRHDATYACFRDGVRFAEKSIGRAGVASLVASAECPFCKSAIRGIHTQSCIDRASAGEEKSSVSHNAACVEQVSHKDQVA